MSDPHPNVPSFRHSGKLGDIIYSLAAVRAFGKANYFINACGTHVNSEVVSLILPLLKLQPYIRESAEWNGQDFEFDLDNFRSYNPMFTNLADCHLRLLGLPLDLRSEPWVMVDVATRFEGQDVVFARSDSFRGSPGFWENLYHIFGHRAIFVGTEAEHKTFSVMFGPLPHAKTGDLLELAQIVAGCRLFIGNQSCPLAIAESLKRPIIQETYAVTPNCIFFRDDFFPVLETSQIPGILDELGRRNWFDLR